MLKIILLFVYINTICINVHASQPTIWTWETMQGTIDALFAHDPNMQIELDLRGIGNIPWIDPHVNSGMSIIIPQYGNILIIGDNTPIYDIGFVFMGDNTVTLRDVNLISADHEHNWAGYPLLHDGRGVLRFNGDDNYIYIIGTNNITSGQTLTAHSFGAGISIENGGSLTIEGSGILNARGGPSGAGIGSGNGVIFDGTLNIISGTVNAYGGALSGTSGAGIGSGSSVSMNGTINIKGGTVTAVGGQSAAGIGGGYNGQMSGTITINGGTVTAVGGQNAAGIGGGRHGQMSGSVTISGRGTEVSALGDYPAGANAMAIGHGHEHVPNPNLPDARITIAGTPSIVTNGDIMNINVAELNDLMSRMPPKDIISLNAYEVRNTTNPEQIAALAGLPTDITWSATSIINPLVRQYIFRAEAQSGITLTVEINITAVYPPLPQFDTIYATAGEYLELPVDGYVSIGTEQTSFTIDWGVQTSNLTAPAEDTIFLGTVYFNALQDWLTMPPYLTVSIAVRIVGNNDTDNNDTEPPPPIQPPQPEYNEPHASTIIRQIPAAETTPSIIKIEAETAQYISATEGTLTLEFTNATLILHPESLSMLADYALYLQEPIAIEFTAAYVYGQYEISFNIMLGETAITKTTMPTTITIQTQSFYTLNPYRVAAFRQNPELIGGRLNPQTQEFTFTTYNTGQFHVTYEPTLRRLTLSPNSRQISDLAQNAPTIQMDVYPIIYNNRTLVPIRFVADALGAEIGYTPATPYTPLTVHLTADTRRLSIPIGQITPQLAAYGMDTPAKIANGRTLVPLRFIGEFFGTIVNWCYNTQEIEILLTNQ